MTTYSPAPSQKSMINQKTNEDFNKAKPDPESQNFKQTKAENQSDANTYTCPMHPEVISEEPGICPNCGMELVVKSGDSV